MCDTSNWLIKSPEWNIKHTNLLEVSKHDVINYNFDEFLNKSDNFSIPFPTDVLRNKVLIKTVPKEILERNIKSAYPVIHEAAFYLCAEFLLFKLEHGSNIEKNVYKNMTITDFIQRLLMKRAISFVGEQDCYKLRDGTKGFGDRWENIGTNYEKKPLVLCDYLSYDELKLSALLSVSSYSYFINNGCRYNNAIVHENRDEIETEGIIVGLIGPRLRKKQVMEFQETALPEIKWKITDYFSFLWNKIPSTIDVFYKFYEETKYTYNEIKEKHLDDDKRYKDLKVRYIFDNAIYAKRLAISFDTFLIEANHRAQEKGKYAYVHVVGIGLGAWRLSNHQDYLFIEIFGQRIRALQHNLHFISDLNFSYFTEIDNCLGYGNDTIFPIEGHPLGGIKLYFTRREPFDKLSTNDKLLVVSYAWDSNAFPGNDFWDGSKGTTSDSATALASQISELHNPYISPFVCADKLKIATTNGLISVQDYTDKVLISLSKDVASSKLL